MKFLRYVFVAGIVETACLSYAADFNTPMDFSKPDALCSREHSGEVEINKEGRLVVCTHEILTGHQLVSRTANVLKPYCLRLFPATSAVEECFEENIKKATLYVNEFSPQPTSLRN